MSNGQMNIASVPAAAPPVTQRAGVPVAVKTDGAPQNGGDFAETLSGIKLQAKVKNPPGSGQVGTLQGDAQLVPGAEEDPVVDLLAQLNASSRITLVAGSVVQKPDDSQESAVPADGVLPAGKPADVTAQIALAAFSQPGRMPEVSIPPQISVARLQNVVEATEPPAIISAPAVEKRAERVAAEPLPQAAVAGSLPAAARASEKSDRMSDVNISAQIHVDRLQNAAAVTDPTASSPAPPEKIQLEGTGAETVRTSVADSAKTATLPVAGRQIATPETKAADLPSMPAEKPVAVSTKPDSKPPATPLTASLPATSPESEIEIHLSQPLPITARPTAAQASADNRSSAMAQEVRGTRQLPNPEHQIEKIRTGDERSVAKEMETSLSLKPSTGESSLDSDASTGGDANQGRSDASSDNQTLAQNVSGQLKTEHQRVSAPSARAVTTEPARQEVPEQVLQQVKERLVHQDLKPGSQQITLTLSPDSLGELKMNLNLQGQKLSVEIITENRTVRDVIVQHTDALKESLARQNITMESFDVTTSGKGSGNQGQNQNAWRELAKQQQQQQLWTSPRGYQTAQADLPSGQAAYQRQQGQSMLDIHY